MVAFPDTKDVKSDASDLAARQTFATLCTVRVGSRGSSIPAANRPATPQHDLPQRQKTGVRRQRAAIEAGAQGLAHR